MTTDRNISLQVIMAAKRLTLRNLSEKTGYSYGYVRNICANGKASKKAHRKIEAALNMDPGSVWTDIETETTQEKKS